MDDVDTIIMTLAGVRPGDPKADLVFNALMWRLLKDIDCMFHAEGITSVLPPLPGARRSASAGLAEEQQGPTWFDDATFFISDPNPEVVLHRLQNAVRVIRVAASQAGLSVNMGEGKTEGVAMSGTPRARWF